jgi:hypothetical protein
MLTWGSSSCSYTPCARRMWVDTKMPGASAAGRNWPLCRKTCSLSIFRTFLSTFQAMSVRLLAWLAWPQAWRGSRSPLQRTNCARHRDHALEMYRGSSRWSIYPPAYPGNGKEGRSKAQAPSTYYLVVDGAFPFLIALCFGPHGLQARETHVSRLQWLVSKLYLVAKDLDRFYKLIT